MDGVPKEIMVEILSRLPITCLVQSMLVCQAWRSCISKEPLFVSHHLSRRMADIANDNIDGPMFLFQSNGQLYFTTDLSDHSQGQGIINVTLVKPFDLLDFKSSSLVDSCNGLLCMLHSYRRCLFICNPFTKHCLHLPNLKLNKREADSARFDLGYHPITKEYRVVVTIQDYDAIATRAHVVTVGSPTSAWRDLGILPQMISHRKWNAKINGRLHWVSLDTSVFVSLDLATEQFEEIPKPEYSSCGQVWCLFHSRGCLSASCNDDRQLEIWVMKEYGVKESWVKEFSVCFNDFIYPYPDVYVEQVVCMLKSGDILLYNGGKYFCAIDPRHGTVKELRFPQTVPRPETIFFHVGSLNWLDTPITTYH